MKRKNYAELGVRALTVRPKKEVTDQYNKLCSDFGLMPSTVLRIFVEKCVEQNRIPLEYFPEKDIKRMQKELADHEKVKALFEINKFDPAIEPTDFNSELKRSLDNK